MYSDCWTTPETPLGQIKNNEDQKPSQPFFQYKSFINYDHSFDVRNHLENFSNLIYAAEHNKEHYFETHLFQPPEVLIQRKIENYNNEIKSVFLEKMSPKNVFNLVVEALHNPNIGVEYQQNSHAYKIRRRYVNKSSFFFSNKT